MKELSKEEIALLNEQRELEAKVAELQKTHEDVLNAVNVDRAELEKLDKEIILNQNRLVEGMAAIDETDKILAERKESLEDADQKIEAAQKEVVKVLITIEELVTNRETLITEEIAELVAQKSEVEDVLISLEKEVMTGQAVLGELRDAAEETGEEVEALEAQLETLNKVIADANAKIAKLNSDITEKEAALTDATSNFELSITALEEQKVNLEATIGKLDHEYKTLLESVKADTDKSNFLVTEITVLVEKRDKAAVELEEVSKSVSAIRAHERYVNAKEDHLRGRASELGVEYKEFVK